MITPNINESETEYMLRLKNAGYDWNSISELINSNYNKNVLPSSYRSKYSRLTKHLNQPTINYSDEYQEKIEQKKNSDINSQLNAMYRTLAREDSIKEIAREFAQTMNSKFLLNRVGIVDDIPEREGLVLISDWHYGIEINSYYNKYNTEIAKQRIAHLEAEIIHRCKGKLSHLTILNLGDMIAGNIHLPLRLNSRIDVISQIMEVSELIAEFLYDLSIQFDIDYYSVLDNHSRIDPNKKDSIQLESLARITDWYIKDRVPQIITHENNYGFDIASFTIGGLNILGVHGDKDKPKNLIDKLTCYTQDHFDIMCSAHYHHFSCDESNNTLLISNGSLMGTDQYASDLRLNSNPSQTLIIISEGKVESISPIIL